MTIKPIQLWYAVVLAVMLLLQVSATEVGKGEYQVLSDAQTQRDIPIHISYPQDTSVCSSRSPCPVALLSSGYGVAYDNYTFISNTLNAVGYLVVAVQHELPGDPPLAVRGDLYTARSENWQRGANSLEFVRTELQQRMPHYNFADITLVGHSNGGRSGLIAAGWVARRTVGWVERSDTHQSPWWVTPLRD